MVPQPRPMGIVPLMNGGDVVVVSNRGPLSFDRDDAGRLVAKQAAGGLASSLGPALAGSGATWVAAAVSDGDRIAATQGLMEVDGIRLIPLAVDQDVYRMAYDVVSNGTLWFMHHRLFDLARRPRFDRHWREAWEGYRVMNQVFAEAVAKEAPEDAAVLVQDYHLALVGGLLAKSRSDLRTVHFSHTPFAGPESVRMLPGTVSTELLGGMAGYRSCGFHTARWAAEFQRSCTELLGGAPPTFVASLGADRAHLDSVAGSEESAYEGSRLDSQVGHRALVVRVDRMELSKNLLRGFLAFDQLLSDRADWRGRVCFVAMAYASRGGLPEYLAYRTEVESVADMVNERWGTADWTPVILDVSDNYPRSVAALTRYDVLLVNPISDGLNLVAKEGPILNTNDGVVALSREAGAWDELGTAALELNPYDIAGTAETLGAGLDMGREERSDRAKALFAAASARSPKDWLDDQLANA